MAETRAEGRLTNDELEKKKRNGRLTNDEKEKKSEWKIRDGRGRRIRKCRNGGEKKNAKEENTKKCNGRNEGMSAGSEGYEKTKGSRKKLIADHCGSRFILTYFTRAQA